MPNSEKKRAGYPEHNQTEAEGEQRDPSREFSNGGEYKNRSVPRYSKINKQDSSRFFNGDSREPIEQRYDPHAARREEIRSDYQREGYALGRSVDGHPIVDRDRPTSNSDFRERELQRSMNDQPERRDFREGASNSLKQ